MTAGGSPVLGPHLPPGARITPDGRLVYCTVPAHQDGEHDPSCTPPADPRNPELRLIRAIFGLCGTCDRTDDHDHDEDGPLRAVRRHRAMAHQPKLTDDKSKREQEKERSATARNRLSGQVAKMQSDREAQDAKGGNGGSS